MDAERHEEIARGLFRESNDALFLFDTETHGVLDLNPVAMRLTGFAKDQARALGVWDLFSADNPGALDRLVEAYRRTGFYHSREGFRLARRDGTAIPVNVSVSRIHTRPAPIGLVVARDVTERKRVEEALRESERRYRGLVETARVVFWTVGADGRVTSLNPQFTAITGYPAGEWIGRPFSELIRAEDRGAATALLDRVRAGEPTPAVDLRMPTRGGGPAILEFLCAPAPSEKAAGGISGIARDVTEARQAAEAIRRAEAMERAKLAAEMADRAKSEFLAHFSHEIRTPMTSILGFTDLLLNDADVAKLPDERLEDLAIIRRSGAHLLEIINDILDLSQIEAGKVRVEPRPCSPARVVEEVVEALGVRAEEKGIRLAMEASGPSLRTVLTDAVRLRQILMNLVGNAVKFTDRGEVVVRLGVAGSASGAEALRIDVSDTGVGLTAEQQSRLFEPFYRVSGRSPGGSGLGLAISRRLAERLGGSLVAASEPGRGSTFSLSLPLDPGDLASIPPAPARAGGDEPGRGSSSAMRGSLDGRVLLAEDNPSIQRVTAMHLEKVGARVTLARNGQQAIDSVLAAQEEGRPFDVVLMDMQMPVLDGYEATRQLRSLGFAGTIIALTAYAMAEDREECLRLGCDDHLSKPIDWALLNERIASSMAARGVSYETRGIDVDSRFEIPDGAGLDNSDRL